MNTTRFLFALFAGPWSYLAAVTVAVWGTALSAVTGLDLPPGALWAAVAVGMLAGAAVESALQ